MSTEPRPPPPPPSGAAPAAKPPSIPSTTLATTALATAADGTTTTISSLGQDQLLDIFLRLPNLPALVRAALTCRPWLGAVRSSPSFRRLFRAIHPAPLLGIFLKVDDDTAPSFAPLRRSDPVVTAALRRGDFFLTSLPLDDAWTVTDCRDGYILLWNTLWAVAVVNPMTWAVDVISFPDDVADGSLRDFGFLGFHLLTSEENPRSFRVVCLCADVSRVRAAVFSSETSVWAVHPCGWRSAVKAASSTVQARWWTVQFTGLSMAKDALSGSTQPPWMSPLWIYPHTQLLITGKTISWLGIPTMDNSALSMHPMIFASMFGSVAWAVMELGFGCSRT
ncbi:hypothetical protein VPH35_075829 [Triticum aestivum]